MQQGFVILRSLSILFGLLLLACVNSGSQVTGSDNVLTGEWTVASQTISPLIITQICKPILKGTTFKFKENALEVYIDSSQKPCNVYPYKISENAISFIKEDMIWLCAYELNRNDLKLKSRNFFVPDKSDNLMPVNKQPGPAQEVVITLTKKNNKTN